jgi:hypothetical protein
MATKIVGVTDIPPIAPGAIEAEFEYTYTGTPPEDVFYEGLILTPGINGIVSGTIHIMDSAPLVHFVKLQITTDTRKRVEAEDDVTWIDWPFGYINADKTFTFHSITAIRIVLNDPGTIRLTIKSS